MSSTPRLVSAERSSRGLLTIAILTAVGPLFVILPMSLVTVAVQAIASSQVRPGDLAELLVFGLLLGYSVGWPYALLTGLFVAAWSLWRQPRFPIAIAAVLMSNIVLHFARPVLATFIRLEPYPLRGQADFEVEFVVFSLIAASICWLVFRRVIRS